MRSLELPSGVAMPVLGLGTWRMGEQPHRRSDEVAAVRRALAMGYRLIDTAEMYGEGGAERVVGQAVAQALRAGDVTREQLFIVSKVYPHNASRLGTLQACERSLSRLGLDWIDLYLLHWRGSHPLADTCSAMVELQAAGRIGHWGVSNFDSDDLQEVHDIEAALGLTDTPRRRCAANQVYYSLSTRGPEVDLLPRQRREGLPLMAYSPIDQGALAGERVLRHIGERHGASAAQVALAWVLAQPGVVAIPKAVSEAHQRANLAAAELRLSAGDLAELDRRFPPPQGKVPLAML